MNLVHDTISEKRWNGKMFSQNISKGKETKKKESFCCCFASVASALSCVESKERSEFVWFPKNRPKFEGEENVEMLEDMRNGCRRATNNRLKPSHLKPLSAISEFN